MEEDPDGHLESANVTYDQALKKSCQDSITDESLMNSSADQIQGFTLISSLYSH